MSKWATIFSTRLDKYLHTGYNNKMSSIERREKVRKRRNLVAKHNNHKAKTHKPKNAYKRQKYRLTESEN